MWTCWTLAYKVCLIHSFMAEWKESFKRAPVFILAATGSSYGSESAVNMALATCDTDAPFQLCLNLSYNSSALPAAARLNRWNQINWLLLD